MRPSASRAVTSAGWRPHSQQVGQTGTRISPELYLACGISGAIQHLAGCQSAKHVIAINTDAEAPIISRADYAVIGDLSVIVPALTAAIERVRWASSSAFGPSSSWESLRAVADQPARGGRRSLSQEQGAFCRGSDPPPSLPAS